jgi:Flp pilus assembly protein protease CpaA
MSAMLLPALALATAGSALTGRAVAFPIVAVAVLSMTAAVIDATSLRIPNRLVLAGLAVVVASLPLLCVVDDRSLRALLAGAGSGWILAGAPVLLVVWLVRPAVIGGGDWKLLSVQGAAIGLFDPLAAPILLVPAVVVLAGQRVIRRTLVPAPLGPALAVGFVVGVAAAVVLDRLLGTASS